MHNNWTLGPINVGKLPIAVYCSSDGLIYFQPTSKFATIVEYAGGGVQAVMDTDGLTIGASTDVTWGERYDYKNIPEMLAWLVEQKIEFPQF